MSKLGSEKSPLKPKLIEDAEALENDLVQDRKYTSDEAIQWHPAQNRLARSRFSLQALCSMRL